MPSNSHDLRELIAETKKYMNHLQHLGVEMVGTTGTPVAQPRQKSKIDLQIPEPILKPAAAQPGAASGLPSHSLFGDLAPAPERLSPSTESFDDIQREIGDCVRCPLHQKRTHVVHTEGNRKARLMFVGEAPGADEDAQARPFVGRAGQLLTKIIEAIGLKREEVLIGNVNRCRPPGNRPPTPEEASTCKPFLLREISIVQPEVIVVLGNTAMRNLLDTKESIGRLRGSFQDYKGIKVMPTFHPAYLLRDPAKKRETWDDLKKVRDYLESTRNKR
jgi:uracil-DNA glycosylase